MKHGHGSRTRITDYLKTHWFSIAMTLLSAVFAGFLAAILLAPREVFQSCTDVFVLELMDCEGGAFCAARAVVRNTWCDAATLLK